MSKECQELVQGDAGTKGGEDTDPVPITTNLDEGPIPNATPWIAPQFIPLIMEPDNLAFPILREEEASVKDSVTFGLPAKE